MELVQHLKEEVQLFAMKLCDNIYMKQVKIKQDMPTYLKVAVLPMQAMEATVRLYKNWWE